MKKMIALVLACLMLVTAFAGCGEAKTSTIELGEYKGLSYPVMDTTVTEDTTTEDTTVATDATTLVEGDTTTLPTDGTTTTTGEHSDAVVEPKPGKKGNDTLLFVGIGGGAVLLIGGGIALFLFLRKKKSN